MSETCIVCLGALAERDSSLPHSRDPLQGELGRELSEPEAASSPDTVTASDYDAGRSAELVAHLLPCGHDLHDECLKPWVERANSCPICRQNFNLVHVSNVIGGKLSTFILTFWQVGTRHSHLQLHCAFSMELLAQGKAQWDARMAAMILAPGFKAHALGYIYHVRNKIANIVVQVQSSRRTLSRTRSKCPTPTLSHSSRTSKRKSQSHAHTVDARTMKTYSCSATVARGHTTHTALDSTPSQWVNGCARTALPSPPSNPWTHVRTPLRGREPVGSKGKTDNELR